MNLKLFRITASIIGPYLPVGSTQIGKYLVYQAEEKIDVMLPPKINVSAVDEAMVVISQDITFDTKYNVEWKVEAKSSKVAYEHGKTELDNLISILVLPASSYKYFAGIIKIEHINESETGPDTESASSQPVHVLGYEVKDLAHGDIQYFQKLLLITDLEIKDLHQKFYSGIKSEVLSTGESNLIYYKILEEISHKVLKRLKKKNGKNTPDYSPILKKVEDLFIKESLDTEKARKIKVFANELRALDYEQIGERILLTAKQFNLSSEVIETLKNINKYRAKVLAHPGRDESEVKLEDSRDIREMARLFILHYMNRFYNIQPPDYEPTKENDSWYQYNYARSNSKT